METLADALLREITRVRDRVLPHYDRLGPAGVIGGTLIRADLDAAVKALAEQDATSCILAYQFLKGTE